MHPLARLPHVLAFIPLCFILTFGPVFPAFATGPDPTLTPGSKMIECPDCKASGVCSACNGRDAACKVCKGAFTCQKCDGTGYIKSPSHVYNTFWALLPPLLAIALALITKEVYSSLFAGVLAGGLLYANFSFEGTLVHIFKDGIVHVLADNYNVGILIFLVFLGSMVSLMNRTGGSAAFGRWALARIKSQVSAQISTVILGCVIFIDDYFNCLTVGSVIRPVTDKNRISRAKLAYLIDSTAAPICIIAPVSSWAAAVAGFAEDGQGLNLFIKAIPYNFYALLTIFMMLCIAFLRFDYGPMARYEQNARENGDLFSGKNPYAAIETEMKNTEHGHVADLLAPVAVLICACVLGMLYSGGFFSGKDFVTAFSESDASVGLMLGSAAALALTLIYYACRRALSFEKMMECIPQGFKAMVPAILILTLAWSLKAMTDSLGVKFFVRDFVSLHAAGFHMFLPAVVFIIGALLAFATGTSWGTFGMLIPIVQGVFPMDNPLAVVCIAACMAGAVCGDHCSPISDTTVMSSAGAQCDHVVHVTTQLPYAVTVAAVSCVAYIFAGFYPKAPVVLPLAAVLLLAVLLALNLWSKKRQLTLLHSA